VSKERGVDEKRLVLWNKAKFPGLAKTAKLRKGTRLALIAPASDEDSHKNAPAHHQQQTAAGYNAKGKNTPQLAKKEATDCKTDRGGRTRRKKRLRQHGYGHDDDNGTCNQNCRRRLLPSAA
jgi:hypothetical protein